MLNKHYKNQKVNNDPSSEAVAVSLPTLIKLRHASKNLPMLSYKPTTTSMNGGLMSSFRGRGMDFAEVRSYQPGDDIRSIDWKVTARTGKAHTKLYQEERERPVYIIVDFAPSMYFGTRQCFKSVQASKAAAILAWSAANHGDRIGGLIFSNQTHRELKPKLGQKGVLPLLKTLADYQQPATTTSSKTSLSNALKRLRNLIKPGSLAFIVSDFNQLTNSAEKHLSQLSRHSDIVSICISDPMEKNPPPANRYTVSNGQQFICLNTQNKSTVSQYKNYFDKKLQLIEKYHKKHKLTLLSLSTTETDISNTLRRQLRGIT